MNDVAQPGCALVAMPDIDARRAHIPDLHHLASGYRVGRIGEGEMSAWERGSGSASIAPMLAVMNPTVR